MKKLKKIPKFNTETAERQFWQVNDSTDFLDWGRAKTAVFPNLKPSSETISLRLPVSLLAELKSLANRQDVPYQSLMKVYLAERVKNEISSAR